MGYDTGRCNIAFPEKVLANEIVSITQEISEMRFIIAKISISVYSINRRVIHQQNNVVSVDFSINIEIPSDDFILNNDRSNLYQQRFNINRGNPMTLGYSGRRRF